MPQTRAMAISADRDSSPPPSWISWAEELKRSCQKKKKILPHNAEIESPSTKPDIKKRCSRSPITKRDSEGEASNEEKDTPCSSDQNISSTPEHSDEKEGVSEEKTVESAPTSMNQLETMQEGLDSSVQEQQNCLAKKVSLFRGGDITKLKVDAIVNAANKRLRGGGGVDGAIHSAAGSELLKQLKELYPDGCETGEAKITKGFKLPAKYVIHAVGPMVNGSKPNETEEQQLIDAYRNSLKYAAEKDDIRTIAFPCISTGIFGYPNEEAAETVVDFVKQWLEKNGECVDAIIFCAFLKKDVEIYEKVMKKHFGAPVVRR